MLAPPLLNHSVAMVAATDNHSELRLLFWETTAGCNLECIHCRRLDVSKQLMKRTTACACTLRATAKSAVCAPSFGISPVGKYMLPMVSGLKEVGVTPLTILKSKVSTWLGAPAIRMKITFCAVFLVVTPAVDTAAAFAGCPARNDAVTPVPTSSRKCRRVASGRLKNVWCFQGCCLNQRLIFSCSLLMTFPLASN